MAVDLIATADLDIVYTCPNIRQSVYLATIRCSSVEIRRTKHRALLVFIVLAWALFRHSSQFEERPGRRNYVRTSGRRFSDSAGARMQCSLAPPYEFFDEDAIE